MFTPSMVPRPTVADQMCKFMRRSIAFPTRHPDHFHVTANGQGITRPLEETVAKATVAKLDKRLARSATFPCWEEICDYT